MSKPRKTSNVRPSYVAERFGSKRLGSWQFTWQMLFFIGQMTEGGAHDSFQLAGWAVGRLSYSVNFEGKLQLCVSSGAEMQQRGVTFLLTW